MDSDGPFISAKWLLGCYESYFFRRVKQASTERRQALGPSFAHSFADHCSPAHPSVHLRSPIQHSEARHRGQLCDSAGAVLSRLELVVIVALCLRALSLSLSLSPPPLCRSDRLLLPAREFEPRRCPGGV